MQRHVVSRPGPTCSSSLGCPVQTSQAPTTPPRSGPSGLYGASLAFRDGCRQLGGWQGAVKCVQRGPGLGSWGSGGTHIHVLAPEVELLTLAFDNSGEDSK